jgi:hypothetical protein
MGVMYDILKPFVADLNIHGVLGVMGEGGEVAIGGLTKTFGRCLYISAKEKVRGFGDFYSGFDTSVRLPRLIWA